MYLSRENHDSHVYKKVYVFSAKIDIVELYCCLLGWPENLKMSKIYYRHEVPVVIHKIKTFHFSLFSFGQYSYAKLPPKGFHKKK